MTKNEYFVGPDFDADKLAKYRELVDVAYNNGAKRGAHMDWSDVDMALNAAIEGLGGEAQAFLTAALNSEHDDDVKISFAEGSEMSPEVWSATLMLLAYRYPESVRWEDVDDAWVFLAQEPAATVAP